MRREGSASVGVRQVEGDARRIVDGERQRLGGRARQVQGELQLLAGQRLHVDRLRACSASAAQRGVRSAKRAEYARRARSQREPRVRIRLDRADGVSFCRTPWTCAGSFVQGERGGALHVAAEAVRNDFDRH